MTRAEVEEMTLREQFELVGQRSDRMHELLADAQLQISSEPWRWGSYGIIPELGTNVWSVRGMDPDNSYFLSAWGAVRPEGAIGHQSDLEPMIDYFDSKGWETELSDRVNGGYRVMADTGEGFLVSWTVQPNGQYNMEVMSKTFWGDSHALLRAVGDRIPVDPLGADATVPGVRVPFPSWDDPATYAPHPLDN